MATGWVFSGLPEKPAASTLRLKRWKRFIVVLQTIIGLKKLSSAYATLVNKIKKQMGCIRNTKGRKDNPKPNEEDSSAKPERQNRKRKGKRKRAYFTLSFSLIMNSRY